MSDWLETESKCDARKEMSSSIGKTDGVLAVTRAIGDFKVFGISYIPELDLVEVQDEDKWLVIASTDPSTAHNQHNPGSSGKAVQVLRPRVQAFPVSLFRHNQTLVIKC
jgi:hypothetical protein